jgi:hypothetical protein
MPVQLTPEAQRAKDEHNRRVQQRIDAENTVIRSFVHHILADPRKLTISVFDGGEWSVKRSRDKEAILKEMRATDQDTLRVREGDRVVGSVAFIYGNAGYEVAADWTATEEFDALIAPALKTMESQKH